MNVSPIDYLLHDFHIEDMNFERSLRLIQGALSASLTPENLTKCMGYIDLISLNATDTAETAIEIARKTNYFQKHFPDYPAPVAIEMFANFCSLLSQELSNTPTRICIACGGYPFSQTFPEIKIKECYIAAKTGADEIDIVFPIHDFLQNNFKKIIAEIQTIKEVIEDLPLKIVINSHLLMTPQNIATACFLAMEGGADFIVTNSGFNNTSTTPLAAIIICECIKHYHAKTNRKVGFKAQGGVSCPKDALCFLSIAETILGKDWMSSHYFRLGSYKLANNLLMEKEQKTVKYF